MHRDSGRKSPVAPLSVLYSNFQPRTGEATSMNTHMVSILIPTYNQSGFLRQAVASALDQDYPHLEVVVCDDASSDWDPHLLDPFATDPRLRIHRNLENLGRVNNYRHCLCDLASGYWILVLDGDDFLYDSAYLSKAMQITASDASIDLVFSNAARLDSNDGGNLVAAHENKGLPNILDGRELFLKLAKEDISLFHSTAIYQRDKAMALDFYRSNIISSDWESLHRYILGGNVAFIDTIASVWRIHGHNATKNISAQARTENLEAIAGPYFAAKVSAAFDESTLESWLNRRLWRIAFKDVRTLIKAGDNVGLKAYLSALTDISPATARRIRRSPKLWIRRLAVHLGRTGKGNKSRSKTRRSGD